jgi:hypothetical protein
MDMTKLLAVKLVFRRLVLDILVDTKCEINAFVEVMFVLTIFEMVASVPSRLPTVIVEAFKLVTAKEPAVRDPLMTAFPATCKLLPMPTPPVTTSAPLAELELAVLLTMEVTPPRLTLPTADKPPYKTRDPEVALAWVESKITID